MDGSSPASGGRADRSRGSGPEPREFLGFTANPGTLDDYLGFVGNSLDTATPITVLYHNLHTLYLYSRSAELQQQYAGTTVLVDGMPVIGLLRLAGVQASREQRVTYVDFIEPLMQVARDRDVPVFHIGQSAAVQQRAFATLRERVPGLQISGHDGYFDQSAGSRDSLDVIAAANASGAGLVLVGFGTPRQEAWLAAHRDQLSAHAVLACGACMEYVAGEVATPPRLLGRLGLEWTWRLFGDPKRFAYRYAVEPLWLGAALIRNALRG